MINYLVAKRYNDTINEREPIIAPILDNQPDCKTAGPFGFT